MGKSSVLALSVLRQIRGTLGRFLAIFAIIALGVGFFVGLRISTDAMLKTAGDYFQEKQLYDFRLISTLGLTDEDVEAFAALDGVETAIGSVQADFLCAAEGGDVVLRAHMLTGELNRVDLIAGRLPQAGDECLLDANLFGEERIGTVLTLSGESPEDVLDEFAYDAYTVVGFVNSPYYASFERGTTALGRGSVEAFLFLLPEGFDTEYYTEIYLSLGDCGALFSDAYDSAVDGMEPAVAALLEARAAERYDRLAADASAQIADAEQELEAGWADYRAGRSDAERELDGAMSDLNDARQELNEGWDRLADGKAELERQRADADERLAEARRELDDGWAALEAGRAELAAQREEAERSFAEARAELDAAIRLFAEGEARLEQCRSLYAAGSALTRGINGILGRQYGGPHELVADLSFGSDDALSAAADNALAAYGMTAASFCDAWTQAEAQLGMPLGEEALAALTAGLDDARARYQEGAAQLEGAQAEAAAAFAQAEAQLMASETQLAAGEREYAEKQIAAYYAVSEAKKELFDAEHTLSDGETDYADGLREYAHARAEADGGFAETEEKLADGQREVNDARNRLDRLETPSTWALDRSANVGCATLENDMGVVRGVSRVFPLFFFLVAALVCVTTMTRMVDEQRTQNGVLKALGYGSGAIVGQYLFYSGSASVLGCVAGFLLGSRFIPMALWRVYQIMYAIRRPVAFVLDWKLFAVCSVLFLLCSLGATWLVCRRELRESAAELIRPKAPPAGKRILLERIPRLWKRVGFLHKVSLRNILRYKNRMVMMILGVGGCTALLLTGFGIRDSIRHIVDYQYDEIQTYDCSVSFKKALGEAEMEAFRAAHAGELADSVFLHTGSMDLSAGGKTLSVTAVVFEDDMDGFVDLHRGEEQLPWPGPGETAVNYRLASVCGLKVGDAVTLRDPELREVTLTVSGIFDNYIHDYVFVHADTLRAQWGAAPEVRTAYLHMAEGADPHAAAASILGDGNVASVSVLNDARELVGNMLSSMNYIVLIVLVCAGALAFIVLYNLTNISINERRREIATLKVLGFYPRESTAYVFRENLILTFVSALVGLPMGYALLRYVMAQIRIGSFYFGCRAAPQSYVFSFALTFLFAAAAAFLLYFKLEKIDMADSLKAVE